MGIENIKEIVKFVGEFVKAMVKTLEDEHFSFTDLPYFATAGKALSAAIKGIGDVSAEFGDMDETERAEIIAFVKDEFDLPDDEVEEFIEKVFRAGIYIADAFTYGLEVFGKEK